MRHLMIALFVAWLVPVATFADDNATTQPSTVTLHLDSVPPDQALEEFTQQTGVTLKAWPDQLLTSQRKNYQIPETVSVNVDQKSFWEALGELCAATHLRPENMGNPDAITLQGAGSNSKGPFGNYPQSVSTSGVVIVNSIHRNHTINFDNDNPQPSKSCGVNLVAYIDPRIRPLKYSSRPNIDKADDDNGKSIIKDEGNNNSNNMQDMYVHWRLDSIFVPLDYDPADSHKLASLKGSISISIAAETEKLEIQDLSKAQGTEKDVAGRHVTIDEVKDENNQVSVKMTIKRGDVPKNEFMQTGNGIFRAVKFLTADNKSIQVGGGGGGSDEQLSYTFNASYQSDSDKPTQLVWEIPTRIDDIEIPFEFKDLPLP